MIRILKYIVASKILGRCGDAQWSISKWHASQRESVKKVNKVYIKRASFNIFLILNLYIVHINVYIVHPYI